jgi:hypothetical protein
MSLFSKIFNIFKPKQKLSKTQLNKIIHQSIFENEKSFENLGDEMDYDGMGNYGRFPPIIGDDYPTCEQIIKEYNESQNSK